MASTQTAINFNTHLLINIRACRTINLYIIADWENLLKKAVSRGEKRQLYLSAITDKIQKANGRNNMYNSLQSLILDELYKLYKSIHKTDEEFDTIIQTIASISKKKTESDFDKILLKKDNIYLSDKMKLLLSYSLE